MKQYQQAITPAFSLASLLPPYHEIKLPTAGLYDPAVPEIVHVRGLTVKELKHITATGKLDRKVFDTTLMTCIQESLDLSMLTVEDYNYIVYMIRLYSNGSKVTAVKACDNFRCGKQFKFEYDISQTAQTVYDFYRAACKEEHGLSVYVEVKRLTRKDILGIETALKIQTDLAAKEGNNRKVFPLIEYLKAYVVSVSGLPIEVPKDQLLDIFSSDDAERISTAFDSVKFGIEGVAKPECPFCHEENEYDIPFTDIFFL